MRVAHLVRAVFPQHGYGGLERAATELTTGLTAAGAAVTLYTQPAGGRPLSVSGTFHGATVVTIPYTTLPLRANSIPARLTNYPLFVERMGRAVCNQARAGALDVVYAHGLCAYGVRQAGRRRTPGGVAPLVMNPHGLEDFKVRHPLKRLAYLPFRAMYRRGAQAADRVIATDAGLRDEVSHLLGVPAGRVVVIPNGVDPAAGAALVSAARQAALRARWGLPEGTFIGLTVARLEANKGLTYLLQALALLPTDPSWRWVLVGSGGDRAALQAQAGALGLNERIVFAGAVDDVDLHNLYTLADSFALASLYEGSSLATLEAMAHSLPIVATAVGGLPDKVQPGVTGLLVPPGDAPAMATAIRSLLTDPLGAARLGQAGAALVAMRFTWAAITAQTLRLFEELLLS